MATGSGLKRIKSKVGREALLSRIPAPVSSAVDLRRPHLLHSWGGALNGQVGRRAIVRELFLKLHPNQTVETGTFRGSSTEFFSYLNDRPVYTAEASERYFRYAERRLAPLTNILVYRDDSRTFLRRIIREGKLQSGTTFFYLDAHWNLDLPLADELEIIRTASSSAVVMVDDFQVLDDDGYGYDDYGSGMSLTRDYIPNPDYWVFKLPKLRSADETGAKRGSCVLFSPDLAELADTIETLR